MQDKPENVCPVPWNDDNLSAIHRTGHFSRFFLISLLFAAQHHDLHMPIPFLQRNSFERDRLEKLAGDPLHKLVCMAREKAGRFVPVVRDDTLEFDASVDADEEE